MSHEHGARPSALWGRLRLMIIGPLLAAPPRAGELRARLQELAEQSWRHPSTGEPVRFGVSTLERWYYLARNEPQDPTQALRKRLRKDAGTHRSVHRHVAELLCQSHAQHPSWSMQLHYDNVRATVEADAHIDGFPSYTTVRRFMKSRGLLKRKKRQAWVELEYNRKRHSELAESPLECFKRGPSVGRPSPCSDVLVRAFRMQQQRTQRRSDGTIRVEGRRFELPSRYRTLLRPVIRYARWDLSQVELIDAVTGQSLCALYPLDKRSNASGRRAALEPVMHSYEVTPQPESDVAPLLGKLLEDYACTGQPPAFLATTEDEEDNHDE